MPETNAAPDADQPFFKALLMPHRSLGRRGFFLLIGAFEEWRTSVWRRDLDSVNCCDGRECCCGAETVREFWYRNTGEK